MLFWLSGFAPFPLFSLAPPLLCIRTFLHTAYSLRSFSFCLLPTSYYLLFYYHRVVPFPQIPPAMGEEELGMAFHAEIQVSGQPVFAQYPAHALFQVQEDLAAALRQSGRMITGKQVGHVLPDIITAGSDAGAEREAEIAHQTGGLLRDAFDDRAPAAVDDRDPVDRKKIDRQAVRGLDAQGDIFPASRQAVADPRRIPVEIDDDIRMDLFEQDGFECTQEFVGR